MEKAQTLFSDIDDALPVSPQALEKFRDVTKIENVYALFPGHLSACRYYRIEIPFRTFSKLGLCDGVVDPGFLDPVESQSAMMGSDVMLWYGLMGRGVNENISTIRGGLTEKLRQRIPNYQCPLMMYDTDDNTDWVHPANPAFVTLGVRNIDGTLLDPNDLEKCNIWTKDQHGRDVIIWEHMRTKTPDGKIFDVARNLAMKKLRDELIKSCDGMTVSNEFLRRHYIEELGLSPHKVFVFPNCVIPEDYPKNELKEHPEEVRIIWQGGASHNADLYPIKEALEVIIAKYPNVKLVVWGGDYGYFFSGIPKDRMIYHNWVGYEFYKEKRTIMNADINLCPLTDNVFSRSKTAIKWYEASILDRPEATLAAKVGPYAEEIQDGETGLLYEGNEQLVEKLSVLIENAELRKSLGENAKKWVIANRNPEPYVKDLYEFYSACRREQLLSAGVS